MIRRVVGIAHVADLDSIADADARSVCEKRALLFGRQLVIASQESGSTSISDIRDLAAKAKAVYSSSPSAIWPY
jgi:5-methylthioribose kinase